MKKNSMKKDILKSTLFFYLLVTLGFVFSSQVAQACKRAPAKEKSAKTMSLETTHTETYIADIMAHPLPEQKEMPVVQLVQWNDVLAKSKTVLFGSKQQQLHQNLSLFIKLAKAQTTKKLALLGFKEKAEHVRVKQLLFEAGQLEVFPVQQAKIELLKSHQELISAYNAHLAMQSTYKENVTLSQHYKQSDSIQVDSESIDRLTATVQGWLNELPEEDKLAQHAVREHTTLIGRLFTNKKEAKIITQVRESYFTHNASSAALHDTTVQQEVAAKTYTQMKVSAETGNSSQSELTLVKLMKEKLWLHQHMTALTLAQSKIDLLHATGDLTPQAVFIQN